MYKLDDYCILMEEPHGNGLETVVMEFFEKHPEYALLGGPYVYHGLACQVVVRYTETINSCNSCHKMVKEIYDWMRSSKKSVDDIWGDEPNEFEGKEL